MDLFARLLDVLGDDYAIERAIEGGGMSHVYLARETALGRRVVIKVLPIDTARALDVERFERETLLAANLQHPNIVPVLRAGGGRELPFYVMPFVEGQSLRLLIQPENPLPLRDAIGYLRDIARALAYAHARGVVHRDIKPENVLISGGVAVVTDFGISKALAMGPADAQSRRLTETGTAMGTPAYMAPEQIGGDPTMGPAVDVYAFGCVAYELLVGRPPFEGHRAEAIFAAHLRDAPAPIGDRGGTVPADVEALLMDCLSKQPSKRPQSGSEVLARLDEIVESFTEARPLSSGVSSRGAQAPSDEPAASSGLTTTGRTRRRAGALVAAGVLVAILAGGAAMAAERTRGLLAAGAIADSAQIVLTDFRVVGADSIIGQVVRDAVHSQLTRSRRVRIVQFGAVRAALDRMERPPGVAVDLPTARELAEREGYAAVIDGEVRALEQGLLIRLVLYAAGTGDQLAAVSTSAPRSDDLIETIDAAARELRERIGESRRELRATEPLYRVTTRNLEALKLFTEGSRAFDYHGRPAEAAEKLERALALDSAFAMAYRKLAIIYSNDPGRTDEARRVLEAGARYRDRMPEAERLAFDAVYHGVGPVRDTRIVRQSYERLFARYPEWIRIISPDLLAHAYFVSQRFAEAESLWALSIREVPEESSPWFDIVTAQTNQGRIDAALSQMNRARSMGRDMVLAHAAMLSGVGRYDEARDSLRAALDRPIARRAALVLLSNHALLRGQLREWRRLQAEAAVTPYDDRALPVTPYSWVQPGIDSLDLVWVDALVRGDTVAAIRTARALFPRAGEITAPGRAATVAAALAELGQPALAREIVGRIESDSLISRRSIHSLVRARGAIALAEGRPLEAIPYLRLWTTVPEQPLSCFICPRFPVAQAFLRLGMPDSATVELTRALDLPYSDRLVIDRFQRAAALQLLAATYESVGNRRAARERYLEFVSLWKDADPELQPRVRIAREAVARLGDP